MSKTEYIFYKIFKDILDTLLLKEKQVQLQWSLAF